jgi:hypothetical protein
MNAVESAVWVQCIMLSFFSLMGIIVLIALVCAGACRLKKAWREDRDLLFMGFGFLLIVAVGAIVIHFVDGDSLRQQSKAWAAEHWKE